MDICEKSWFTEVGVLNSETIRLSLKYDKIIYTEKTKFQELVVFHHQKFGNCLVLDDCIQCTDFDEFSYHEMISFLPLNCHSNPKRVLIIGGGDGGVAREVLKHPLVEEVVLCEIDESVVNVSKKYFPKLACSFKNPKLKLIIDDGIEYVHKNKNSFDVIITDSSDPKGPAEVLFQDEYYKLLSECLRNGGIICSQAESYWFDLDIIKALFKISKKHFSTVNYAYTVIPSYPSGQIGFLIACKDLKINFNQPIYKFSNEEKNELNLKYYSEQMHKAAFTLPEYLKKELSNI